MAENFSKDDLNAAISAVKQMRNHFKAFAEADKALVYLANLVAGIADFEQKLIKKRNEVEGATIEATKAKSLAILEADKFESQRKALRDEHSRTVAQEKQVAEKKISEIQDSVLRFKNELEESVQVLKDQSAELEKEVRDKRAVLDGLNKEIEGIKARLGG